jgi:hypothetical protein
MGGVTWIAALLRQKVMERLWTTLTIKSSETEVWEAMMKYLTANDSLKSKVLTAKKKKGKRKSWRQRHLDYMLGKSDLEVEYTPGDNCRGMIEFEGESVFLERHPDGKKETVGWSRQLVQPEIITLRMWGQDSAVLKRFLKMAVVTLKEDTEDEINIMCIGNGWPGGWQKAVTKKTRSLESVVQYTILTIHCTHHALTIRCTIGTVHYTHFTLHAPCTHYTLHDRYSTLYSLYAAR